MSLWKFKHSALFGRICLLTQQMCLLSCFPGKSFFKHPDALWESSGTKNPHTCFLDCARPFEEKALTQLLKDSFSKPSYEKNRWMCISSDGVFLQLLSSLHSVAALSSSAHACCTLAHYSICKQLGNLHLRTTGEDDAQNEACFLLKLVKNVGFCLDALVLTK